VAALTVLFLLLLMVAINVPIGFSIGIAALLAILIRGEVPPAIVPMMFFYGANKFQLIAIPLFMVTGELMNITGISQRIINFASSLVGFVRGGLAMVTVIANMFMGGISGSAIADVSALGSILIPEMKRQGYPSDFATALNSCTASLAIIIPPSIGYIVYGAITDTSISAIFVAGVIPGILLGVCMMLTIAVTARKKNYKVYQPFSWENAWRNFKESYWGLLIPVVIIGGILGGIFTATEAAAVSVVIALFAGFFVYRSLSLRSLKEALLVSGKRTGIIMFVVASSVILSWFFTVEEVPQALARSLAAFSPSYVVNLLLINVLLLIAGMLLDGIAIIIMMVPILLPLVRNLGIDLVHFCILLSLNLAIGQQTPPVASVLITACAISGDPIEKVVNAMKYLLLAMLFVLLLVSFVPQIALLLPRLVMGR
jgi:C4-dicarboxylate transporter, DctM subunit